MNNPDCPLCGADVSTPDVKRSPLDGAYYCLHCARIVVSQRNQKRLRATEDLPDHLRSRPGLWPLPSISLVVGKPLAIHITDSPLCMFMPRYLWTNVTREDVVSLSVVRQCNVDSLFNNVDAFLFSSRKHHEIADKKMMTDAIRGEAEWNSPQPNIPFQWVQTNHRMIVCGRYNGEQLIAGKDRFELSIVFVGHMEVF